MEKTGISVVEVLKILKQVISCIKARVDEKFIPNDVENICSQLKLQKVATEDEIKNFKREVFNMYRDSLKYVENWIKNYVIFEIISYIDLETSEDGSLKADWQQVGLNIEILASAKHILIKIHDFVCHPCRFLNR